MAEISTRVTGEEYNARIYHARHDPELYTCSCWPSVTFDNSNVHFLAEIPITLFETSNDNELIIQTDCFLERYQIPIENDQFIM